MTLHHPATRRTERFGSYTCDPSAMLNHILKLAAQVQADTARRACAVRANPLDLRTLVAHMFPDADPAPLPVKVGDMWVFPDETVGLGVAELVQCALPHPVPEDCVYHARTRRRLVQADELGFSR